MYEYEFERKKLYNLLGEGLVEQLKAYECFVAGGCITSLFCNKDVNDFDIYFRSENHLVDYLYETWEDGNWVVSHTKKATLIKYNDKLDVQLIHFKYFENAEDIFKTFDFSVCMGAFDFKTEQFILHKDFLKHNSQRLLKFNANTSFPIVSALRVQKYENKGYKISKPEYIKILLACMNLKINSYEELKEQMGGMYGINYDKLFREVEKEGFSLEKAIELISDLCYDEDYFKEPVRLEFDSVEDIIDNIVDKQQEYFIINDKIYRIREKGQLLRNSKCKPVNGIEVSAEEYFNTRKIYKFVNKVDNRYFSFYDENYEYKIGEIALPKERGRYGGTSKLYGGELLEIDDFTYSDKKTGVLIELEINKDDFIEKNGSQMTFKKCKVLREVPKEEYEHILEKEEIEEDNERYKYKF